MSRQVTGPCEMSAGYDDRGPGILILKCGKPGVGRPELGIFGPPIACDDCYNRWQQLQRIVREDLGLLDCLERADQRHQDPEEQAGGQ